jgi:hypothetical protein
VTAKIPVSVGGIVHLYGDKLVKVGCTVFADCKIEVVKEYGKYINKIFGEPSVYGFMIFFVEAYRSFPPYTIGCTEINLN